MGNERLARQINRQPLRAALKRAHREPRPIHESNISRSDLHSVLVLGQRALASDQKKCAVPIRVSENLAASPRESANGAGMIHRCRKPPLDLERGCRYPMNASRAHPTGKSITVADLVFAPASRADQNRPLLEVQLRTADESAALFHDMAPYSQKLQTPGGFNLN